MVPKTLVSTRIPSIGGFERTRLNVLRQRSGVFSDPEDRLVALITRRLREEAFGMFTRWRRKKDAKYGIQPHITPTLISTILWKVSKNEPNIARRHEREEKSWR
jgi:hypothetical protein